MLACRTSLAAGILPNTPERLHKWLYNPGGVKQGNFMATMIKKGTLNDDQINQIISYLETLKPEGGCPVITGVNADKVQRLADTDGSTTAASDTGTAADPDDTGYINETRYKS